MHDRHSILSPKRLTLQRFLLFLIDAFVNTFGITQPTRAGAARAARTLGWVLLGVAVLAAFGLRALFAWLAAR